MQIFTPASRAAEDNHTMNKERDLLPWIFGGLSAAAMAVAFAAVSTHRATPALAPQVIAAQPPASPPALAVATTAQVAPPAAQPDSAPPSAPPPQPQTAVEPDVQAGQIWECMTKGVKTFSNNPCGEKSTLLDVGPINTMPPAPTHYARASGPDPRYSAGYPDQSAAADADDYSDQNAADTDGNSYSTVLGVGLVPRRRAERNHRSYAPPPPPAHHNSAPVRRY
jgi:hypothetical protein